MKPLNLVLISTALILSNTSIAAGDNEGREQSPNRLGKESSPYLLHHANNPVDWFPWGPEAFEKAKAENKPIFLSVGYSSCYWCHVMERKVFSDKDIASYMNDHFVNIKVDREERPDVDEIYMTSLIVYQQLTGSGSGSGWPLSMFLTPEGNPIAGATYLAPADSPTMGNGFPTIAKRIAELWSSRKEDLQSNASLIAEQVQRITRPQLELQSVVLTESLVNEVVAEVKSMFDPVWGGVDFNSSKPQSPRFPNVPRLELALDIYEATGDSELLDIVKHSLTKIAQGGIRDHLAGGFHRYSTDRMWHVPHFEKMLYDQAMLLGVYSRAFAITNDETYAIVAAEIADFVLRDMTNASGGFCSAFDAETNAIEGEYYVWSHEEIENILGKSDAELFGKIYGLDKPNSFEHGFVLHQSSPLSVQATELNTTTDALRSQLSGMRAKLLTARNKRMSPTLDDKVLTAWNAMMIRSLAISGRVLNRPEDIAAAVKAADFLMSNLQDKDSHLLRTWRNGSGKYSAYLDDYAFLVSAFLELHTATNNDNWISEATKLAELQNELFYDKTLQAFYYTANDHEKLIARTSSGYDSVFPSANSLAVRNLLKLNGFTKSDQFCTIAEHTLSRFASAMQNSPKSCAGLASALNDWLSQPSSSVEAQSSMHQPSTTGARYLLTSLAPQPQQVASEATSGDEQSEAGSPTVIQQSTFRPILPSTPAANGFAQDEAPKPLKVKVYPMYSKLPRNGKCLVAIELQVKLGWHINANPSNPDFLVPTSVKLKTDQKVKLTKIKYPKHHELKVDGSDEPYHVYDGKTIIYGLLETEEVAETDFAELEFHVAFQGCNSTQCLPPDSVVMKGKLPIAANGEELQKIHEDKFPKPETKPQEPTTPK